MNLNAIRSFSGILFVTVISSANLLAQERNDVIKYYNEGAKSMQTDVQTAITAFENVVTMSDKVGETAADLKQKAVQVLPGLYFKLAYNALNQKKPAPEVVKAAKTAIAAADKYGSATNKENAGKVLLQGYNIMANDYFSKNDYEKALLTFDSLLLINPGYLTAIYNKALIYVKQNNPDAVEQTVDLFLGKLDSVKDADKIKQASSMALEYFRSSGSRASQAEKPDEALVLLNKAAKYGDDKDLFYFFADVYNKQKDFDKGAEYARKGLALETGNAEAKAKFYYQLAVSQVGKGQTSEACGSFKNSLYGAFAEASKAQRKNLKCE